LGRHRDTQIVRICGCLRFRTFAWSFRMAGPVSVVRAAAADRRRAGRDEGHRNAGGALAGIGAQLTDCGSWCRKAGFSGSAGRGPLALRAALPTRAECMAR